MADNVTITPGSGKTIAADDIASVYYQRVKVGIGADGAAADLNYGQQAMTSSLPVTVASDQSAVKVDTACLQPNSTQADQRLTVADTAGGVQFSAFHADTTHVYLSLETAEIRVTFDGSAPTSTNGHILPVGYAAVWSKALATAAKFIRTGGSSGVIHASQMKL